jgi:hypothetical protein
LRATCRALGGRKVVATNQAYKRGGPMIDFLISLIQAACALLLIYGAVLALIPARKPRMNSRLEDELVLLRHMHNDA